MKFIDDSLLSRSAYSEFYEEFTSLFSRKLESSRCECSMKVTVTYATPKAQFIKELEVSEGATVITAIEQSDLLSDHPEISLEMNKVGIFNQIVSIDTMLKDNDRIEIYRPLTIDPMGARRLRAKENIDM